MQWKPNVTVAAVVIDENDRFLLVEEYSNDQLVYNQPAGHLENGETLIEAVIRETREETAHIFQPEFITGIYMYPETRKKITYMRVCFCGSVSDNFPDQTLDEGIVQAKWLSREELLQESDKHRSKMVLHCIDDYLSGKRYPLDLLHSEPYSL